MYRNSAHLNLSTLQTPPPADDQLSDSQSEFEAELATKRKQVKEEIKQFKAQKEKEFAKFEKELRAKRRARQQEKHGAHDTGIPAGTGSTFSVLLYGKQPRKNGSVVTEPQQLERPPSPKSKPSTLPSKTLALLDKRPVNGTITPPRYGTSPRTKSFSRSPQNLSITPPRKSFNRLPGIPKDKEGDFAGLFTPAYLPLLESRPGSSRPPGHSSSPPAKRAFSTPTMPSQSLPSALRTASGSAVQKKRVTFQLTNLTIVEPSSSYEEMRSPGKLVSSDSVDELMNHATARPVPKLPASPTVEMSRSPNSFSGRRAAAHDGGSGVGFFELDEELEDIDGGDVNYHEEPEDDIDIKAGDVPEEEELKSGSFHAGSLPIAIVRPGSFRVSSVIE